MPQIPRDPAPDGTFALLREGYRFIGNRCDSLGSDIFTTRLMLRRAICMRGKEAAEFFYGSGSFTRRGAMPATTLRLLQDRGSVQLLDGSAHRHRKAMFVGMLMDGDEIARSRSIFRTELLHAVEGWRKSGDVVLMEEMALVLSRTAIQWCGLGRRLDPEEFAAAATAMIENAGRFGPRAWLALTRRRRSERVLAALVRDLRGAGSESLHGTPFATVCNHRDLDGRLLPDEKAAVELLNLLRPIVAVARFIAFAVVALAAEPGLSHRLKDEKDDGRRDRLAEQFAEEVRRISPFFPFVGGRALRDIEWNGFAIGKGAWVLLDLYGTDRLARRFAEPERFELDRGLSWRDQGFDFIPQGGGDARVDHRCPGEAFTVGLIAEALKVLVETGGWNVPEQDLSVDLARIPAQPASGLVLHFAGTASSRPTPAE